MSREKVEHKIKQHLYDTCDLNFHRMLYTHTQKKNIMILILNMNVKFFEEEISFSVFPSKEKHSNRSTAIMETVYINAPMQDCSNLS